MDFSSIFSRELVHSIFNYLDVQDLRNASLISVTWYKATIDDYLWKRKVKSDFGSYVNDSNRNQNWKRCYQVESNWRVGRFVKTTTEYKCKFNHIFSSAGSLLAMPAMFQGIPEYFMIICDAETNDILAKVGLITQYSAESIVSYVEIKLLGSDLFILLAFEDGLFGFWKFTSRYSLLFNHRLQLMTDSPEIISSTWNSRNIVVCTAGYEIIIFNYNSLGLKKLFKFRSNTCYQPLELDLKSHGSTTILILAFPNALIEGWEPITQRIEFSDKGVVSSSCIRCNGSVINPESIFSTPVLIKKSEAWNPFESLMESIVYSYAPITCIEYAFPWLFSAHKDGSIHVYFYVAYSDLSSKPHFIHYDRWISHNAQIRLLVYRDNRLISCAKDGIKVWRMPTLKESGTSQVVTLECSNESRLMGPTWIGSDSSSVSILYSSGKHSVLENYNFMV